MVFFFYFSPFIDDGRRKSLILNCHAKSKIEVHRHKCAQIGNVIFIKPSLADILCVLSIHLYNNFLYYRN